MNLEDIKLQIKHYTEDEEDNEEAVTVCTVYMVKKENIKQKYTTMAELDIENNDTGVIENYCICIESNYENREVFFDDLDFNFCKNIEILNKTNKIGNTCLNRIFVEDIEGVIDWIDNEAPNSMQISTHICKKDFKIVEGRFVGIIDELILDNEYVKTNLSECIIYMVYLLVRYWNFDIYYLYTQPKSLDSAEYLRGRISPENLKIYQKIGFEVVNKKSNILRKNLWEEKNKEDMGDTLKSIYLS